MKKIILPSTSFMVTEACTLKCKLCLAFSPYYSQQKTMSLNEAKKVFNNYFAVVDTVKKVSITGGEPLLNKDIEDIFLELIDYEHKIEQEIILITNGTIKLNNEFINILRKSNKIKVIVNYYGDISPYAQQNYYKLKENSINCILYTEENRYGWIDCRNHELKHKDIKEQEKQATSCAFFQGKKYVVNRGKLYTCTRAAYRIQENIIPHTSDAYIDLINEDINIQKEKLIRFINAKSTISCAYCDGLTENSTKYIAAEQL